MGEVYRVEGFDGAEVAFEVWPAQRKAPLVLFAHGLYSDRRSSSKALALRDVVMREGFTYAALDFYGRGDSEGDFTRTSPVKCVASMKAVLDALRQHWWVDSARVAVVGSSFGGLAALLFAAQNPKILSALVLIAPALNLCEADNLPQLLPDFKNEFYEETRAQKPFDAARKVTIPTLVIQGDADDLVPPETAKRLVGVMPNARLLLLPRVGHAVPQGRPMLTLLEATINFLREVF